MKDAGERKYGHEPRRAGWLVAFAAISILSLDSRASAQGFGDPLPGLTAEQLELFQDGRADFEEIETIEDGLGPTFNAEGCAVCHASPAVGGTSPSRNEVRAGTLSGSSFDPLEDQGGSLFQIFAISPECQETVPSNANVVAERQTQPLFGMGLIEAIPAATIASLADPDDRNNDGVSGRVGRGRFGWKAQVVSLLEFSGDAYLNEMGITNDLFPVDNDPNGTAPATLSACDVVPDPEDVADPVTGRRGIDNFTNFMRFLGPPPRGAITPDVQSGAGTFNSIGCTLCHIPQLKTGQNSIAALANKAVPLYSDLLLHDVGDTDGDGVPGDGIAQSGARPEEIRTPPLWGLRASAPYLHDGSASTIEEAILRHGGEANAGNAHVIDNFRALTPDQRAKVLAFLNSL